MNILTKYDYKYIKMAKIWSELSHSKRKKVGAKKRQIIIIEITKKIFLIT